MDVTNTEHLIRSIGTLFVTIAPLPVAAIFLSITQSSAHKDRNHAAMVGCVVGYLLLVFFGLTGEVIFNFFGVSQVAFKIGSGILLFSLGLSLVLSKDTDELSDDEKTEVASATELGVTPLAVPFIAGPGAISAVVVLQSEADTMVKTIYTQVAIFLIVLALYVMLRLLSRGALFVSPIMLKIANRISGLVLASMAVQFILDALKQIGVIASNT